MNTKKGSRVVITGLNGSGKTTLLKLIAGKHWHEKEKIMVFGKSAFFDSEKGEIAYVGLEWRENPIVKSDIEVSRLLKSMGGDENEERKKYLINLFDIDENWHMHRISE